MKELAVISGKGGTGKTSISAALIALQKSCVSADCDVDAANLHLIINPDIEKKYHFYHGKKYRINHISCSSCGKCLKLCRFNAIDNNLHIDPISCEGCSVCAFFCPERSIESYDNQCGEVFIGKTEKGPAIFSRLSPGEGNSGKLVAKLREETRKMASGSGIELIILDGPPGTGCPVISTITGVNLVLIVTEPNISALHDLKRAAQLTSHFRIKTMVCINRADLNPEISEAIRNFCLNSKIEIAGEINRDQGFIMAQRHRSDIVAYNGGSESMETVKKLKEMNNKILRELNNI